MRLRVEIGVCLGVFLAISLAAMPAAPAQLYRARVKANFADQKEKAKQPGDSKPVNNENKAGNTSGPAVKPAPAERNMMGLPPALLGRVREMPPEQQERFLANNERFQKMTPRQQAQIREQLHYWNSLSPEQRQQLREREQVWEKLTPEQRQYVHDTLLPKWQAMAPASKQAVRRHLERLQGLSDAEREQMLNNPAFMRNLTPDEQQMLRELSRLRVASTDGPGL